MRRFIISRSTIFFCPAINSKLNKEGGANSTADVNSFIFYSSFRDAYEALKTTGQDREYLDALFRFAFDGETTRTGDVFTDAFISAFEPQITANKKRRENGKKGGAPKNNKNAQKQPKVENEKTHNQPNVNVNENVNVNVNGNGNANSNVNENANVCRTPPIDSFYTEYNERRKAKQ